MTAFADASSALRGCAGASVASPARPDDVRRRSITCWPIGCRDTARGTVISRHVRYGSLSRMEFPSQSSSTGYASVGRVFRVDLAYPAVGLAIELDGWEFHHTRSAFDQDRSRANALVAAGWTLVRFTSRTTDAEMLRTVRRALERCGRSGVA